MALFYRKDDYLTGSFPRKGGLIARNTAADSLCGRVALISGKPASGARNIQAYQKLNRAGIGTFQYLPGVFGPTIAVEVTH